MAARDQVEQLLSEMMRAEKAQLLQRVSRDLGNAYPGIDSDPNICGGEPHILRTRIPVWILEQSRRLGVSETELLFAYPTLRAEDLINAWSYTQSNREEIDQQIAGSESA